MFHSLRYDVSAMARLLQLIQLKYTLTKSKRRVHTSLFLRITNKYIFCRFLQHKIRKIRLQVLYIAALSEYKKAKRYFLYY